MPGTPVHSRPIPGTSARWYRWLVLLAIWVMTPVLAIPVDGLYTGTVRVAERQSGLDQNALYRSLEQVLIKVSGNSQVLTQEGLAQAASRAEAYAEEFHYLDGEPGKDGNTPLYFQAVFNELEVNRLLGDYGVGVWGRERPETLVWLAVNMQGRRFVLPAGSASAIQELINLASVRRGVPVQLPIMDGEDLQAAGYADISGGFMDRVLEASQRYGQSSVLVGRLDQNAPGQWDARWTHLSAGQQQTWSTVGVDLAQAISTGVDGLADNLALRFVAQVGVSNLVRMTVQGVQSQPDYARALNYLQSLSVTEDVQPVHLLANNVVFDVTVKGDMTTLSNVIAIGDVLVQDSAASDAFRLAPY